jgi:hypothetical protein
MPGRYPSRSSALSTPRHADQVFLEFGNTPDQLDQHVLPELGINRSRLAPTKSVRASSSTRKTRTGAAGSFDNSNWKVCRQDPGPSNHPATIRVAIYSVKLSESC